MDNAFVGYFLAGFYTFVAIFYTPLVIKRNERKHNADAYQSYEQNVPKWLLR